MSMCLPYFSRELKAGEVRRDPASSKTCTHQQSGQPPAKIRSQYKRGEGWLGGASWCGHLPGGGGQTPIYVLKTSPLIPVCAPASGFTTDIFQPCPQASSLKGTYLKSPEHRQASINIYVYTPHLLAPDSSVQRLVSTASSGPTLKGPTGIVGGSPGLMPGSQASDDQKHLPVCAVLYLHQQTGKSTVAGPGPLILFSNSCSC